MKENSAPVRADEPSKTGEWLTRQEAAQLCGLTVATMDQYRQLRRQGIERGPAFVQMGKRPNILYSRTECEAWLLARAGK